MKADDQYGVAADLLNPDVTVMVCLLEESMDAAVLCMIGRDTLTHAPTSFEACPVSFRASQLAN